MQATPADLMSPINGEELAAARVTAGLTQRDLADLLGNSERAVQNWEATHVTQGKEPLVRAVLGDFLAPDPQAPPLRQYSDWALLAELHRRLVSEDTDPTNPGDGADTNRPTITPGRIVGRGARRPRQR